MSESPYRYPAPRRIFVRPIDSPTDGIPAMMTVPTSTTETLSSFFSRLQLEWMAGHSENPVRSTAHRFASALFVDVNGFSTLAAELHDEGAHGIERLSQLLDAHFSAISDAIRLSGGDVAHFAGDSILAVFCAPNEAQLSDAIIRAGTAALAIQKLLKERIASADTAASVRTSVGAGRLDMIEFRGADDSSHLLFAGEAVRQATHYNAAAQPDEVLISSAAFRLVSTRCRGTPVGDGSAIRLLHVPSIEPNAPASNAAGVTATVGMLRRHLSRVVAEHLKDNRLTSWMSEFRTPTVLFVHLPDPDVDDPVCMTGLEASVAAAEHAVERYGGMSYQLVFDDKGTTYVGVFGGPSASGKDNAGRALQAALHIREVSRARGLQIAIGLATGVAYCGVHGSDFRRQFTIVGTPMIVSSRLSQKARPGEVLADDVTLRATRLQQVTVAEGRPRQLKGLKDGVLAYRVESVGADLIEATAASRRTFGRGDELGKLAHALGELTRASLGQTILLEGEPGIGKSQLVAELVALARTAGVRVISARGEDHSRRRESSSERERATAAAYSAWRSVFTKLLNVEPGVAAADSVHARIAGRFANDAELADRAPLLNDVLQLDLPENDITSGLRDEVRADNVRALLLKLMEQQAAAEPTLLIVEDEQWLDSASRALLQLISARVQQMLVVATRRTGEPVGDGSFSPSTRLLLQPLAIEHVSALARDRLGVTELAADVAEFILRRSGGNPFFAEELAAALLEYGVIRIRENLCRSGSPEQVFDNVYERAFRRAGLPGTLQGIVTSRLDQLRPADQLVAKQASVLGRRFSVPALAAIVPGTITAEILHDALYNLSAMGIIARVDEASNSQEFVFRHSMTRDVAYGLLPIADCRKFHQEAAQWLEKQHADNLAPYTALLAHHWQGAHVAAKAFPYLVEAGAAALHAHAGKEAVSFLTAAASFLDDLPEPMPTARSDVGGRAARVELLLGRAYLTLSMYADDREHFERGLKLMGWPVPRSRLTLMLGVMKGITVQCAHRFWPSRIDQPGATREPLLAASNALEGLAETYYYMGDEVRTFYACLQTLNLAEMAGVSPELARGYASLGTIVGYIPLHRLSEEYGRKSLEVARAVGKSAALTWVWVITGIARAGRGDWQGARALFEEAREVSERVGDRRRWADALGHLAVLDCLAGKPARALDTTSALIARAKQDDDARYQLEALRWHAHILLDYGDPASTHTALDDAERLVDDELSAVRHISRRDILAMRAVLHARAQEHEDALNAAREALELIDRGSTIDDLYLGYLAPAGVAEAMFTLWDDGAERARDLARLACRFLERHMRVFPVAAPRALLYRGAFAARIGNAKRAQRCWRRSASAASALGMPLDTTLAEAELARHGPDRASGRTQRLHQIADRFEQIGARYYVARLHRWIAEAN
jgi:class 3 adenylate cyclase/tetratricopeptide (TPR) repeat protein